MIYDYILNPGPSSKGCSILIFYHMFDFFHKPMFNVTVLLKEWWDDNCVGENLLLGG